VAAQFLFFLSLLLIQRFRFRIRLPMFNEKAAGNSGLFAFPFSRLWVCRLPTHCWLQRAERDGRHLSSRAKAGIVALEASLAYDFMTKLLVLSLLLTPSVLAQLPPGNEKGVSMGHLHLRVSDLDVHKKLWIDALGAKAVKLGRLEAYQFPGVQVLLSKGPPSGGTEGSVVDHLGFKVKNLEETKAKLTAAGAKVLSENPKVHQMFIELPDGIKVEFYENAMQSDPVVHDHIHFAVPQIDEQRAWYEKMFGAVPGMSGIFKAADVPGVNLRWRAADSKLPGTKGRGVDHIGFEVTNLEAFCKKLEAEGVKFDMPYRSFPQMGLSIAFLTDPWGVYIELTEGLAKMK